VGFIVSIFFVRGPGAQYFEVAKKLVVAVAVL
jgi:hypothetical protein